MIVHSFHYEVRFISFLLKLVSCPTRSCLYLHAWVSLYLQLWQRGHLFWQVFQKEEEKENDGDLMLGGSEDTVLKCWCPCVQIQTVFTLILGVCTHITSLLLLSYIYQWINQVLVYFKMKSFSVPSQIINNKRYCRGIEFTKNIYTKVINSKHK